MNIEKLIEFVRQQPVLYDKNHRSYRNNDVKAVIWEDIGRILNAPAEKCKFKWNMLRSQYIREKGKPYQQWIYFKKLTFLEAYLSPRAKKLSNSDKTNVKDYMDDHISSDDDSIDFDETESCEKNTIVTTPSPKSRKSDAKQKATNVSNMCKNPITDFKPESNNAVNLYCQSIAKTIIDQNLTVLQFLQLQEKLIHTLKIEFANMQ